MRAVARSGPLLSLVLLPAACIAGCFGSSSSNTADSGPSMGLGDSSTAPAAGGTGAFGIITVTGKDGHAVQKMYLPQTGQYLPNGNAFIAVVDVGAGPNGAPAQLATIDLGSTNVATATGGDSTVVIAVSTDNSSIYFIDPTTDTLTKTLQLDSTYGKSGFSGGGGYVTGVAIDSANHRGILSVWDGFALVDLTAKAITAHISAPPTENFGFDSVHQRIIAPFYDCTQSDLYDDAGLEVFDDAGNPINPKVCTSPMLPEGGTETDGLSIIDLTDNTVYTYAGPITPFDAGSLFIPYDPMAPVGREPDSASADPTTGIVVVPSEGDAWQNVIDLSKATFDKASHTVKAPLTILQGLDYDAVAVEPNKHLAFWEQEFAATVAVANLSDANMGSGAAVQGEMPDKPDMSTFANIGDPHGIAVTTALTTSGPVGFVVDSQRQWVGRVDLAGMLAAGGADATAMLTTTSMAPFVTYLDALTPIHPVPEGGADASAEAGDDGGAEAAGDDGGDSGATE
jgi:hypothetical protein